MSHNLQFNKSSSSVIECSATTIVRVSISLLGLFLALMLFADKVEAKNPKSIPYHCNVYYQKWKKSAGYAAFALSTSACGWSADYASAQEARARALKACRSANSGVACHVIAEIAGSKDSDRPKEVAETPSRDSKILPLEAESTVDSKLPKKIAGDCNKYYQDWRRLGGYGAFAKGNRWCQYSYNRNSIELARKLALSECAKHTKGCKIVVENNRPSLFTKCNNATGSERLKECTMAIESRSYRREDLALIYNQRGRYYHDRGELESAKSDYSAAIESSPSYSWAYSNRGMILEQFGMLQESLDDAEKALELFKAASDCGVGCDIREPARALIGRLKKRMSDIQGQTDQSLCQLALTFNKSAWESKASFQYQIKVVQSRGLSIGDCRLALGYERTPSPFEAFGIGSLCSAALDETRVAWRDEAGDAAREAKRRKMSVADCRVAIQLPRDPVRPDLVKSANELLRLISEYGAKGESVQEPTKLATAAAQLNEALTKQVERDVVNGMASLRALVEGDPGYPYFLATREEREAQEAEARLADDKDRLVLLRKFALGKLQSDLTSAMAPQLVKVVEAIDHVPTDATQDVITAVTRYVVIELRSVGLGKELTKAGIEIAFDSEASSEAAIVTGQKRVALVIGNSAYQRGGKLANPVNDAKALSGLLRRLGFDVVEGFDADRQTLEMLAAEFETKAKVADASLFFFAGHAVQANGQNYLLPIDAVVRSTEDLDRESLILDVVARSMSTKGKLGVVLIDACRDNPFEAALNKNADGGLIVRPIVNGLTEPTVTSSGLLYGFATSFGQTASDGDGDHSPFTSALIKHLPAKGQLIEDVMAQVRYEVIEMTEKRQNPWITTGLLTKFYMNP